MKFNLHTVQQDVKYFFLAVHLYKQLDLGCLCTKEHDCRLRQYFFSLSDIPKSTQNHLNK